MNGQRRYSVVKDESRTKFQQWWNAQRDLLTDASQELDEREWATFIALLTIRVAAENARFLELERRAA